MYKRQEHRLATTQQQQQLQQENDRIVVTHGNKKSDRLTLLKQASRMLDMYKQIGSQGIVEMSPDGRINAWSNPPFFFIVDADSETSEIFYRLFLPSRLRNFSSRKIIETHHISGSIYLLCTLQGFIYIIKANPAMEIILNDVLPFNLNRITNTK